MCDIKAYKRITLRNTAFNRPTEDNPFQYVIGWNEGHENYGIDTYEKFETARKDRNPINQKIIEVWGYKSEIIGRNIDKGYLKFKRIFIKSFNKIEIE